jgi:hypothetical protein
MNATAQIGGEKRKANRRLALVLGFVALGFYLLMVLFNR